MVNGQKLLGTDDRKRSRYKKEIFKIIALKFYKYWSKKLSEKEVEIERKGKKSE